MYLFLNFPSQTEAGVELVKASGKKAIAERALAVARKESVATSGFFAGLARRNPASKAVLEKCAADFKEAVQFLNLKGLEGGTASLDVHYALDDAESCESALSSGHVHIQSATARIQKWKTVYSAAEAAVIALEN
ncbi:hypothetical protein OIU74_026357 [Salix koriyanagi]|uniref:Pectinesterase inhibitor domain-containing protein n=1 Tax=Salix koriyanagi TaxID=2511006 RepID=A0A9Q0W103_9ROSI|nr:hypothetical protein OIU74_026357 [Salix koriyanagi]